MARQTTRRRAWIARRAGRRAGRALGRRLGAAALAAVRHDPVAVSWPDNMEPLADFVERTTGLGSCASGPHRVHRRRRRVSQRGQRTPTSRPTSDGAAATTDEAMGRALGFWSRRRSSTTATTIRRGECRRRHVWTPDAGVHRRAGQGRVGRLPVSRPGRRSSLMLARCWTTSTTTSLGRLDDAATTAERTRRCSASTSARRSGCATSTSPTCRRRRSDALRRGASRPRVARLRRRREPISRVSVPIAADRRTERRRAVRDGAAREQRPRRHRPRLPGRHPRRHRPAVSCPCRSTSDATPPSR